MIIYILNSTAYNITQGESLKIQKRVYTVQTVFL